MASIFTRIVRGELPSYTVAEDERALAFLDIHPLKRGHVLVVPKEEVDVLFDLEPSLYAHVMEFARKLAGVLAEVVPCERVGMAVLGMEVPHAHIHLIPIDRESDLLFTNPRVPMEPAEFAALAESLGQVWKLKGYESR
ncbi:HIT domain-containing protein [bacterium]|nr:HIT domain-containing protein [bacterium]